MNDEEKAKKQEYLRDSILAAGYDTEAFLAFMHEKKGKLIPLSS